MATVTLKELLRRGRMLEARRAAAIALAVGSREKSDQLARKRVEEVLSIAEAARREAQSSYILEKGRLRLRLRRETSRDHPRRG